MFRFFDVATGTLSREERAAGPGHLPRSMTSWIADTLHYSNGLLILMCCPLRNGPAYARVWRLGEANNVPFVRDIILGEDTRRHERPRQFYHHDAVVDKENAKLISIRTSDINQSTSLSIVTWDIEDHSDGTVLYTIVMPHSIHIDFYLGLCGDSIIVAALRGYGRNHQRMGLGFYVLRQDCHQGHDSQHAVWRHQYFPCLEEGTYLNSSLRNILPSKWNSWLGFQYNNDSNNRDAQSFLRAVVFNDVSGEVEPVVEDEFLELPQARKDLLFSTNTRVFVHNPDEDIDLIEFDELNIKTGTKVRTICTGFSTENYMLAGVNMTDTALYCMLSRNGSPESVILTFLL